MGKTKIEWTEHSWSPVTGCTKVSEGCRHCYAECMARRLAGRYGYPEYPHHFDVTLHPDRLNVPLRRKKPTTYFVCSMGDLFHEDVPDEFIRRVFRAMYQAPQHIFMILTKRPRRMQEFVRMHIDELAEEWFKNRYGHVYLGVSAESQTTADERIPLLLQTPAVVRFISAEPLLGPIDLRYYMWDGVDSDDHPKYKRYEYPTGALSWCIIGGESGPGARPMRPDWAREIRDQCQEAGVPFFFKSWGKWLHSSNMTSGDIFEANKNWRTGCRKRCWPDGSISLCVGKKQAGRLLDGREWNEMPEASR